MSQRSFFAEHFQLATFDSRENQGDDYQHKFIFGGGSFYNVSVRVLFIQFLQDLDMLL